MVRGVLRLISGMPTFFYAVASGRKPGIYKTWDECKAQVHRYTKPVYKKFSTYSQAEEFVKENSGEKANVKTTGVAFPAPKTLYALGKKKVESDDGSCLPNKKRKAENDGERRTETKDGYIVDDEGYTVVYTDGACQNNGRKGAKAGIGVWFGDDHPLNVSEPLVGDATNNKAEINAVITAVRKAKSVGIKKLKVHTDSQFLISCTTKWMQKWKQNGWRTTTGNVKNKIELIELEKTMKGIDVQWNHVNGHVGIYGNEMADKLARGGCASYKSSAA